MAEFFHMGGYGFYVWTSYAAFFVALAVNILVPRWRRKRVLQAVADRQRRLESDRRKHKQQAGQANPHQSAQNNAAAKEQS